MPGRVGPNTVGGSAHRETRSARLSLSLLFLLTVFLLTAAACAAPAPRELAYAPADLRAAIIERTGIVPPDFSVPFVVTEEDIATARRVVAGYVSTEGRARALANAIRDPSGFGITYEPTKARTARQAIDDRRGDCLGTSSVFIGLARALGMRAYYLDASDRVSEVQDGDELIVSSGHVSAVVRTDAGYQIIDFDNQLSSFARQRIMDDIQALAHYYNNRGYELLDGAIAAGEPPPWEAAREQFFTATRLNTALARAWNNLAIADGRLGNIEDAETHYRVAIAQDDSFAEPHNNLGTLYLREGRVREAVRALKKSVELAPLNPFHHYHYSLALARFGERERALEAAEEAVRLNAAISRHQEWLERLYSGEAGGDSALDSPDVGADSSGTAAANAPEAEAEAD